MLATPIARTLLLWYCPTHDDPAVPDTQELTAFRSQWKEELGLADSRDKLEDSLDSRLHPSSEPANTAGELVVLG